MLTIQADAFRVKAEAMVIESDETVIGATNLLGFIKQSKKQFEDKRTGYVKPLNDQVKQVNDAFKTITAPLDSAETILKQKVLIYNREQEKKRQEEIARIERERKEAEERQRALEAEHEARRLDALATDGEIIPDLPPAEIAPVELPPELPTMTRTALGSATVKKVWMFEVAFPAEVPRQYLIIDERLIREAVRAGVREIPGVRIYQDDQLAIGR
jgi:hypothetical protein